MTTQNAIEQTAPARPGSPAWSHAWPIPVLAALAAFVAGDLVDDVASGVPWKHLLLDLAALGLAIAGAVATAARLRRARRP